MMTRPQREEDLEQAVSGAGLTWDAVHRLMGKALGIDPDQVGTLETANVIIGGIWPTPLLGSKRYRCDSCEGFVALAPSSQRMLAARAQLRIVCLRCARGEIRNEVAR
jgi:hypothetical protein